MSENKNHIVLE